MGNGICQNFFEVHIGLQAAFLSGEFCPALVVLTTKT